MKKMFIILTLIFLMMTGVSPVTAEQKIVDRYVNYTAGGVTMKGYLAYDQNITEKRPGIRVVHEWWGQNDYVRNRARMLAKLGYVAFAVDMYGDGKIAEHPKDATLFSSQLSKDFNTANLRFDKAESILRTQPQVDPDKIAAIGYCFGGGVVLNMALQGADLKGVASFHGSLGAVKEVKTGAVKAKIIIFNGEDDKFNSKEAIESIREKMKNAGVDYQFISYPGAIHAFTNPDADKYGKKFNIPLAYNARADKESWEALKIFLEGLFK